MIFGRLNSYSPIGEIKDFVNSRQIFKNQKEKRSAVKICVIDDEPFSPNKNLLAYGYDITEIDDLKSID